MWLGGRNPDGSYFGDHYKWRVMRSNGVPEEYITGDKPDRERFQKFAEALPMAIGNPMYHWTNLELHVFFGYDGVLNGDTAEEVWNLCNDKLQHDPKLTVRGLPSIAAAQHERANPHAEKQDGYAGTPARVRAGARKRRRDVYKRQ